MSDDIRAEIERLRGMSVPELLERYTELHGSAPRCKNRTWLWKRCAWKVQEHRYGGLSGAAKARLEQLINEIDLPVEEKRRRVTGRRRGRNGRRSLSVGTVLTRVYKGREIRVCVVETGFEYDGELFRSLSAIAKRVTGSHWSGRLFFNLRSRKKTT